MVQNRSIWLCLKTIFLDTPCPEYLPLFTRGFMTYLVVTEHGVYRIPQMACFKRNTYHKPWILGVPDFQTHPYLSWDWNMVPQILGVQNLIFSIELAISGRISWIMGRTWEQNCELYLCPAIECWVWTQIPMQMCNMYCIPRIVSRMFLQETLSKLDGNQGFLLVLWVAYRCFAYPSPVVTLKAMSKNCIPQKKWWTTIGIWGFCFQSNPFGFVGLSKNKQNPKIP